MLQQVKNSDLTRVKDFNNEDFYEEYSDRLYNRIASEYKYSEKRKKIREYFRTSDERDIIVAEYAKILKDFFTLISIEILKGFRFHTPIGTFQLVKKYNRPGVRSLDHHQSKIKGYNVYRDKDYYFRFDWAKAYINNREYFKFKPTFTNYRSIPDYEEEQEENVTKIRKF